MTPANSGLTAILCCLLVGSGCGQSEPANPLLSDNDTLLNELLGSAEETAEISANSDTAEESDSLVQTADSDLEIPSTENDTSDSIVDDILGSRSAAQDPITAAIAGNFEVNQFQQNTASNVSGSSANFGSQNANAVQLRVGDQFPFLKTVRQTVVQKTTDLTLQSEDQVTAQTLMQLTMLLSVLDSSASGHLLQVRYDRVQYSQDVNGTYQAFDSAARLPNGQMANPVPAGIEAYAGMVGAGFRFTVTHDNKVVGTDGFALFLDQCVSAVPFEQRVAIRSSLEQRFQSGGIAELIDESIGMLPYGSSRARAGDVWVTDRQLQQQSPIQMQTTCRLVSTSNNAAEIGLTGRIESATGAAFKISDGRTMGTCFVNLTTGLPLHSQRSSYLKIAGQQTAQRSVEITKKIETMFTSQSPSAQNMVQQHRLESGTANHSASLASQTYNPRANGLALPAQPVQSASLPGSEGIQFPSIQGQFSNQSTPVHPVSSANAVNGLNNGVNTGPSLQIPSGAPGSVPAAELKSSVEAVYPD
ncbi:MAG: DUF6263 family protein [Fuerstiella sp.]